MISTATIPDDTLLKICGVLNDYCGESNENLIYKKISGLPIDSIDFVEIVFEIEEILGLEIDADDVDFNTSIMQLVSKNYAQ